MIKIHASKVDCPRCKDYVVIPVLSEDERAYVAGELRKFDSKIQWVKWLREWADFDIADAKRFVDHFSYTFGSCTRCSKSIHPHSNKLDHVICPHCRSLNLDWKTTDEIFPYVDPTSIAYMWNGEEGGWVIAKREGEDGVYQSFINVQTKSALLLDAEYDNYAELFDAARTNGVPEVDFKEIFQ